MGTFKIEGVTHWPIAVNNLKESEDFYGGMEPRIGRTSSINSCS